MRSLRAKNKTKRRIIFGGDDNIDYNQKKKIWEDLNLREGNATFANFIKGIDFVSLGDLVFENDYCEFLLNKPDNNRNLIYNKFLERGYTNIYKVYNPNYYYTKGFFTGTSRQESINFFKCLQLSKYGYKINVDHLIDTIGGFEDTPDPNKLLFENRTHHRRVFNNGFNSIDRTFFTLLYQYKLKNFDYNAIYEEKDENNVIKVEIPLNNFKITSPYFTKNFILTGEFRRTTLDIITCTFTVDPENEPKLNTFLNKAMFFNEPQSQYEVHSPCSYTNETPIDKEQVNKLNAFFERVYLRSYTGNKYRYLYFDYNNQKQAMPVTTVVSRYYKS